MKRIRSAPVLEQQQEPPWPSNFPRIQGHYSSRDSSKRKGCVSLSMLPCDLSRSKRKWPIGSPTVLSGKVLVSLLACSAIPERSRI